MLYGSSCTLKFIYFRRSMRYHIIRVYMRPRRRVRILLQRISHAPRIVRHFIVITVASYNILYALLVLVLRGTQKLFVFAEVPRNTYYIFARKTQLYVRIISILYYILLYACICTATYCVYSVGIRIYTNDNA